jgi:hypothetical protein
MAGGTGTTFECRTNGRNWANQESPPLRYNPTAGEYGAISKAGEDYVPLETFLGNEKVTAGMLTLTFTNPSQIGSPAPISIVGTPEALKVTIKNIAGAFVGVATAA